MARARNIKPSFFTNELIGTLDPIVGLTFIGLWCLADRDGRLEDRPLRIKAELFPYRESLDLNGYLTVLERSGFVERYEVGGTGYIQIVNFTKHQTPHHTEKAKGYPPKPAPVLGNGYLTVKQPLCDGETQVPTRSDSLIPDSLIQKEIPPIAPQGGQRARKRELKVTLTNYIEKCKAEGKKPIPEGSAVFRYAAKANIPSSFLRVHWEHFRRRYAENEKRYIDWQAVFNRSVQENWFRVWFINNEGEYELTTVGKQNAKAMEATA